MVPVLSSTTTSRLWVSSSASPVLINRPAPAPFPVPTIIATGVASPSAHGQDTTKTAIADDKANVTVLPHKSHTIAVTNEMHITMGTKIPAILSASLAIGALLADALSTISRILEKAVSSPTFFASTLMVPLTFIDADKTVLSFVF